MIPIPAMKMCENDSLACCGFNEFRDRSMTAVTSGKLEKHRTDYLFNKKRKREKKPTNVPIKNSTHAPRSLHGGGSHSALRVCSQTRARVAFLLLCPALL